MRQYSLFSLIFYLLFRATMLPVFFPEDTFYSETNEAVGRRKLRLSFPT